MAVREVTIDRDYYSHKHEIYDWCRMNLHGNFKAVNMFGHIIYTFENGEDHMLFLLTWGDFVNEKQ